MVKRYITLLLLLCSMSAFGQATIQFIPELYGRNVDGLFKCTIINAGAKATANLSIVVKERKAGTVCVIKTQGFSVLQGANPLPFTIARGASVQFSNNGT